MPDLLLLTNRYPYGTGEEYLEPELPHLVAAFDRVIVVPTMQTRGQEPTRAVPAGVVVVAPDLPAGRLGRVRLTLDGLVRGGLRPGLPHLPGPPPRSPVPYAYEVYFEARSQAVARRVAAALAGAGLEVPEVIYSYWLYVTARVADLLAGQCPEGRPVVVSRAHGYDVNVEASPVGYLPQRELLLERMDRVHPVSEAAAVRLRAELPQHAHKVSARRLGSTGSSPEPVARQAPLHVLTVSTVRPLKRLDLVADAVADLQREGVPLRWTHIGGGRPRALTALRRRTSRLVAGSVELTGPLPHDEVLRWYAEHHPSVLVNVSTSEGVPVSVMEAMAHGVPVLATDVGGTAELLVGQPGLDLLPPRLDPAYLADALRGVAALTPDAYAAVCRHNQASWRAGWDAEVVLARFAHELAALAGEVRR
ncbi:glycosyltransferase [Ornithinimicrobium sp. F0845]|uniref:glycosyltransferase n=1 Tax=Ornithinimicrobium sp. F0845 TaxID=2926412 RepID=UPI001FF435A4|nr:glycosyltransferase [Ornithinimicrobium sp. F0845]MCK0112772.1 glycosyltransferase [Ornithinimicrobium sp. F0845]